MLERTRTVVVNTTPIIALALIGQLDLLQHLYGEVMIPPAVQAEVLVGGPSGGDRPFGSTTDRLNGASGPGGL